MKREYIVQALKGAGILSPIEANRATFNQVAINTKINACFVIVSDCECSSKVNKFTIVKGDENLRIMLQKYLDEIEEGKLNAKDIISKDEDKLYLSNCSQKLSHNDYHIYPIE